LLDKFNGVESLTEILVVSNSKFEQTFEEWAAQHRDFKSRLRVLDDGSSSPDDRLGSIGDINFVLEAESLQEDLLVVGGDNLFDCPLDDFLQFAQKRAPEVSIGLFDIGEKESAKEFGVVSVDQAHKVTSFEEKPAHPKSSLIAMCLYYFPEESLGLVAQYLRECQKADKAGDYIRWLCQKQNVHGYQFQGKWFDIGSIESYREAQKAFSK